MILKVGDRVRVKEDLTECDHDEVECYLGIDGMKDCPWVNDDMVGCAGDEVAIEEVIKAIKEADEE